MTEGYELKPNNLEEGANYAELRAQIMALKETKADPHFENMDPQALIDEDLDIYYQLLKKTLTEKDLNDWRKRIREETKSLPRSYDAIRIPDRVAFAAYVANKLFVQKGLGQLDNFVK